MNGNDIERADEERERAHYLHENYLADRDRKPTKAGEHLWGAINNLLCGIYRIQTGEALHSHSRTRQVALDLAESSTAVTDVHFEAAEDLHENFYHGRTSGERIERKFEQADRFYDFLDRKLGGLLEKSEERLVGEA